MVRAFFWGAVKIACLALFAAIILLGKKAPMVALMTGLSTLLVVPLVGGYLWSRGKRI